MRVLDFWAGVLLVLVLLVLLVLLAVQVLLVLLAVMMVLLLVRLLSGAATSISSMLQLRLTLSFHLPSPLPLSHLSLFVAGSWLVVAAKVSERKPSFL